MSFNERIWGPLAAVEYRRYLSRRWMLWTRVLIALPALAMLIVVSWICWFMSEVFPNYRPTSLLSGTLILLEGMAIAIALVLAPATLAGTLAGEKDRGTLGMLLIARVSCREIVFGKLASRLGTIGVMLLASLPVVAYLAALASIGPIRLAAMLALPAAVAFGGGGLALAASTVARRGRDALMAVYVLNLLFLVLPLFQSQWLPPMAWTLLETFNPFHVLTSLVAEGELAPACGSIAIWMALGLIGAGFAAWRLGPVYLKQIDGGARRGRSERSHRVGRIGDRPMLWKELYIERARRLGGIMHWIGLTAVSVLLFGSLGLAGLIGWGIWIQPGHPWGAWAAATFRDLTSYSSQPLSWLIQWTIGLRASFSIASERERHTWDTLLTTALEGKEIVYSKVWGSLYALRWLCAAAALAWSLAVLTGAMDIEQYVELLAGLLFIGGFMAAVGVLASVSSETATRAMTLTLGAWLLAAAMLRVAAVFVVGFGMLVLAMVTLFIWMLGSLIMGPDNLPAFPNSPVSFETAYATVHYSLYAFFALLIAVHCRHQFDRLAGRAIITRLPLGPALPAAPAVIMAEAVSEPAVKPLVDAVP